MLAIYRPSHEIPHSGYIIELLKTVLQNTYFDLNGKHYHQVSGTVMRTNLAPSNAILLMARFERLQAYTYLYNQIYGKGLLTTYS